MAEYSKFGAAVPVEEDAPQSKFGSAVPANNAPPAKPMDHHGVSLKGDPAPPTGIMRPIASWAESAFPAAQAMGDPEMPLNQRVSGAIEGTAAAAAPFALPAFIRNLPRALPSLVGAAAAGKGAQYVAGEAGASPDTSRAIGDVAGLGGGAAAWKATEGFPQPNSPGMKGALRGGYEAAKQIPLVGKVIRIPEAMVNGYQEATAPPPPPEVPASIAGKGTGTKYQGPARPAYQFSGPSAPKGFTVPSEPLTPQPGAPPPVAEVPAAIAGKGTGTKYQGPARQSAQAFSPIPQRIAGTPASGLGPLTPEGQAAVPPPPEPFTPFKPNPRTAARMKFGGSVEPTYQPGPSGGGGIAARPSTTGLPSGPRKVEIQHLGDMRINGRTPPGPPPLVDRFGRPIRQ